MPYNLELVTTSRHPIFRQISQYYSFCEQIRRMTPVTVLSKTYVLNNFVQVSEITDLRKISNQDILSWIDYQYSRGNSGRSINVRLAHLKAMLRWQSEMGLKMPQLQLPLIPKVKESPPRKNYFTRDQIQLVLSQANEIEWLLVSLGFDCGLRISEIQNLRLSDLHSNYIDIIGKGQKRRHAYLNDVVIQRLAVWVRRNNIIAYLWPSPITPNRPLATCSIRKYMREAFARVGLVNFCPHDLRHSYATDLKNLGIPTRQIQAGLGHSSERVTEQYLSDLDGFDLLEMYQVKYAKTK